MVEVTQEDRALAEEWREEFVSWDKQDADEQVRDLAEDIARHRTTALAAKEAELAAERAKVEKLREALHDAICMIGHAMPMDTTVLAGQRLVAREVWQTGYDLLHPKPKKEIA